jgi:transposase-like protein
MVRVDPQRHAACVLQGPQKVATCVVRVDPQRHAARVQQGPQRVATGMRAIYSAPTVDAAELALKNFGTVYGAQYPDAVDARRNAWGGVRAVSGLPG